eukprot:4570152-Amphidinium_carterae.1
MPRARRMGLELRWKSYRSVSNAQRISEKAWVDTENRSLLHATAYRSTASATCTWTCDIQLKMPLGKSTHFTM